MHYSGYPLHRENRENGNKKIPVRENGIWKFGQNSGKIQGIWFAQVVNSLMLKVKDISVFAAQIIKFCLKLDKSAKSVLYM